jgi:hypothetical protein
LYPKTECRGTGLKLVDLRTSNEPECVSDSGRRIDRFADDQFERELRLLADVPDEFHRSKTKIGFRRAGF